MFWYELRLETSSQIDPDQLQRLLHYMSQETDSEQESEDSSDSDGDNKEVCKVNQNLGFDRDTA